MAPMPDFCIIGAQKSGTTSLYDYLCQHPGVAPAVTKELHFFDFRAHLGLDWYREQFPSLTRATREPRKTGEATPYYMLHPLVPGRVAKMLPDLKLIAVLRDPVERAASHHHYHVASTIEFVDFEAALELEPLRLRGEAEKMRENPAYQSANLLFYGNLAGGRYAEQLERWWAVLPRANMLVIELGELSRRPASIMAMVYEFLELESFAVDTSTRSNVNPHADMRYETRQRLSRYFRPHNERLFQLLGREFAWS